MLNSVKAVVEALGGDETTASLAGVGITAVANWKGRDNKIPAVYFLLFSGELARKDLRADPAVFGLKAPAEVRP